MIGRSTDGKVSDTAMTKGTGAYVDYRLLSFHTIVSMEQLLYMWVLLVCQPPSFLPSSKLNLLAVPGWKLKSSDCIPLQFMLRTHNSSWCGEGACGSQ